MPDSNTLNGKIALITGGSRNIGRETALELAKAGADIVITYRERQDAAAQTVSDLEALGVKATAIQVDLTGTAHIADFIATFKAVLSEWGKSNFDILVNNAGILRLSMFENVTEADLDANYATNYKSVFFLTQGLMDCIADGGRVINIGSRAAQNVFPPLISYGPIKAAVQSLTPYLAAYLGKRNITVNAVSPGGLDDDFNAYLFNELMPQAREHIASSTALGRIGIPTDVSKVIAFLCSDEAAFISGAIVPIDGGYHL